MKLDALEWQNRAGIDYLLIRGTGEIIAEARLTHDGSYKARFGVDPIKSYIDRDSARRGMIARWEEVQKELADEAARKAKRDEKKVEEKKVEKKGEKKKEKKDG